MKWRYWVIAMLVLAVAVAGGYFSVLKRHLRLSAQVVPKSEEQVRRELTQPAAPSAGEPIGKARLYWSSGAKDRSLMPVTVDLRLSMDPALRSKQVLNTLLAGPVDAELRTLPPDAVLLAFYLLPDGTAVADFSEALATATPSGIESEQMAVDSITKTLEANVPQVRWLKILVHGQEVDTLAGHLDLTRTFLVNAKATAVPSRPAVAQESAVPTPALAGSSASGAPAAAGGDATKTSATRKPGAAQKLTPTAPSGKLATPPSNKP
jgi:Sporulation and spore germination